MINAVPTSAVRPTTSATDTSSSTPVTPIVPPQVLPSHSHAHAPQPIPTTPHGQTASLSESLASKVNGSAVTADNSMSSGGTGSVPPQPPMPEDSQDTSSTPPQKPKSSSNIKMLLGVLVFVLLLVGAGATYFLTQNSQDIRQRASTGDVYGTPTPAPTPTPLPQPPAAGQSCAALGITSIEDDAKFCEINGGTVTGNDPHDCPASGGIACAKNGGVACAYANPSHAFCGSIGGGWPGSDGSNRISWQGNTLVNNSSSAISALVCTGPDNDSNPGCPISNNCRGVSVAGNGGTLPIGSCEQIDSPNGLFSGKCVETSCTTSGTPSNPPSTPTPTPTPSPIEIAGFVRCQDGAATYPVDGISVEIHGFPYPNYPNGGLLGAVKTENSIYKLTVQAFNNYAVRMRRDETVYIVKDGQKIPVEASSLGNLRAINACRPKEQSNSLNCVNQNANGSYKAGENLVYPGYCDGTGVNDRPASYELCELHQTAWNAYFDFMFDSCGLGTPSTPPPAVTLPTADFAAVCTDNDPSNGLNYTFTVSNIKGTPPFMWSRVFIGFNKGANGNDVQAIRDFLGTPTWDLENWYGYQIHQFGHTQYTIDTNGIGSGNLTVDWNVGNNAKIGTHQGAKTVAELAAKTSELLSTTSNLSAADKDKIRRYSVGANIATGGIFENNVWRGGSQNDYIGGARIELTNTACTLPAAAPMCMTLTAKGESGQELAANSQLTVGQRITFSCGQVAGVNQYAFRVKYADGSVDTIAASSTPHTSVPFTVSKTQSFKAQCTICPNGSCYPFDTSAQSR